MELSRAMAGRIGAAVVVAAILAAAIFIFTRARVTSVGSSLTNALSVADAATTPATVPTRLPVLVPDPARVSGLFEFAGGSVSFVVDKQQRVGLCGPAAGTQFSYSVTASSRYLYADPEPGLANVIVVPEADAPTWISLRSSSGVASLQPPLADMSAYGPGLEYVSKKATRSLKAQRMCVIVDNVGPYSGPGTAGPDVQPLLGQKVMRITASITWS